MVLKILAMATNYNMRTRSSNSIIISTELTAMSSMKLQDFILVECSHFLFFIFFALWPSNREYFSFRNDIAIFNLVIRVNNALA